MRKIHLATERDLDYDQTKCGRIFTDFNFVMPVRYFKFIKSLHRCTTIEFDTTPFCKECLKELEKNK